MTGSRKPSKYGC